MSRLRRQIWNAYVRLSEELPDLDDRELGFVAEMLELLLGCALREMAARAETAAETLREARE